MRRTFRLLASVKPARYLEAGRPTGLTGLYTHPSPRSTLLYLYSSTLDKLKAVPEHSVYRQSVEALTKQRMAIVEAAVPPGYEEWAVRARKIIVDEAEAAKKREILAEELEKNEKALEALQKSADAGASSGLSKAEEERVYTIAAIKRLLAQVPEVPKDINIVASAALEGDAAVRVERGGQTFFIRHTPIPLDQRDQEWDGDFDPKFAGVGMLKETAEIRESLERALKENITGEKLAEPVTPGALEPEPQLTVEQISEIETKIGAGLIEEVVQVAEGELRLVDTMVQAKVWESLEEQPAENQWQYFERKS
ncbi:hypothetical protein OQA88_7789 [Cercophora sp. LCS_1]